jgi:hypothetical protein
MPLALISDRSHAFLLCILYVKLHEIFSKTRQCVIGIKGNLLPDEEYFGLLPKRNCLQCCC